jgi:EmrB/QacA subfamily drug resistance transporter
VTDSGKLSPEVRKVAIVVIVGAVMSILDTTIVNVAIDTLVRELHAPLSTVQWVSTGYLLALATVIPLTGWAAERFGPKRVWMTAVAAFAITSALCGLSWNIESLIAFRVLQGVAGGMIMPIGMITLAQTAGPARMGRVMSVVGVPMLLAPVFGPVLGGFLVTQASWRWIFFVNVPIGAIGLLLAARLMHAERSVGHAGGTGKLDRRGLALLSPGVALIVFGLSKVATDGTFASTGVLVPMAIGAALLVTFALHAWRTQFPLVDVRLLGNPGFAAAAATIVLVGAALFGGMLLLPLYYQVDRGLTALQAGLLIAPQGLGAAISMNIGGKITDRRGGAPVVLAGLAILSLGTLPFALVGSDTSYWALGAALFVRGLGLGAAMMPAMASAYALLERHQVPRATPLLNVLQRLGGSLGVAILAVVLERQLADAGPAGSPEAVAQAFGNTYWWALALTAIATIPATVLLRRQHAARREAAAAPVPPVATPAA